MGRFYENVSVESSCLHCHTVSLKEMKSQLTQGREGDMVPTKSMR